MQRIFIALFAALLMSCGGKNTTATTDFCDTLYHPQYASGFEILRSKSGESTMLITKAPWQGADASVSTQLLIARNGESAPAGFDGQILDGEARRIVCMSSTHIAMLDAIGETDRVVGVSGIGFISNKNILKRKDQVKDVGYDGNIDYEQLMALNPDLVMLYAIAGASSMESKLRELRIPFVYIGEYMEESPIGKAEWMVAVAEIVGKRSSGEKQFLGIPERYNKIKAEAAKYQQKPKIMVNTPYRDSWVMPSTESYLARLIADAGGDYIYKRNTSNKSMPIDMEEAFLMADQSDLWINVGALNSLAELRSSFPKFADTKPVKNHNVYNCTLRINPNGGNDFWESGIVHPDLILQDLIQIFHPQEQNLPLVYYKRLE